MTGRKSAPALGGFKSYYSSGGDSENVQSGKSRIDFFPHSVHPHFLLIARMIAAQMETSVWFCAKPPMSHSILCTRPLWVAPSWTRCATTDLGDAMTAAPSSVTPVTIPIMIWTKILPSAGWASQVTANIPIVIDTCANIFVQPMATQGRARKAAGMCNVVAVVC